jgi:hypothetical protein
MYRIRYKINLRTVEEYFGNDFANYRWIQLKFDF